jgi:hypothetical protein
MPDTPAPDSSTQNSRTPDAHAAVTANPVETFVAITLGDRAALHTFVAEFGDGESNPASLVVQSTCAKCAAQVFWMQCSEEDGVALRTCTSCRDVAYIGDSEEHWSEADTGDAQCVCGKKMFEIAVGYCRGETDEVNWIIVGARCVTCSTIGVYADWSIDYEPTAHLLEQN